MAEQALALGVPPSRRGGAEHRRARWPALAAAAALALNVGCASGPGASARPSGAMDQADASPPGPPIDPDRRAVMEAQLAEARARYLAAPRDEEAAIWYGRRLAYLGRYHEAIDVYTRALAEHPDSHRLLRHRGHRYITLRRFDEAARDLTRAARRIRGVPDEVEPDGQPNRLNRPRSTSHSNIYYHLGLAHYLRGDFDSALDAYRRAMEFSRVNDDMTVATSYWLYLTLRRLGRDDQAAAVLAPIRPDMEVIENHAYQRLLMMFKGALGPEQVAATEPDAPYDRATIGYGLGMWRLVEGDGPGAREAFEQVVGGDQRAAFGYIAAEAELARLGEGR